MYLFLLSFVAADDLVSELTYKFDMLRRFINIDETNHSKGSSGDKGGSRSKSLINPHIPRADSRFAKDSGNHTTGCYGSNPLEPMPSAFIYGSGVKDKSKLKLRPGWVEGLPVARGKYGFGDGRVHAIDSHVSVRKGGGQTKTCSWQQCCFT